jgi:putative RNA 2'-phosphotransferase
MVAAAVWSCTVIVSVQISKFLSLVLRHDPGRVGIALDDAGWIDVATLLAACAAHGVPISRDGLAAIVASSDKQRFAFSPDGKRIRANQGHSIEVDLQLPPVQPPATLFHGTAEPALASIRTEGLVRGKRHHVHLSNDVDTVARRSVHQHLRRGRVRDRGRHRAAESRRVRRAVRAHIPDLLGRVAMFPSDPECNVAGTRLGRLRRIFAT